MKRKIVVGILATITILFIAMWLVGTLLSAPANQLIGDLPADLTGRFIQFPSESGATVHGWFIEGRKGAGAVVLMHGVRANRLSMLERARFLARAGYSVLLFDFQAHGESRGEHITFGCLESRDARAAVDFLHAILPHERIGVIGVSMGGAAVVLASPPLEINAVALEMVYPTISQAISNRLTMRLGGWANVLTPLLSWQFKPRLGVSAEDLRPIAHVGSMSVPKLFIVGEDDQHTTLEESNQLFSAANQPKEMWVVPGAGHVDLYSVAGEEYERRILLFFEEHLRR